MNRSTHPTNHLVPWRFFSSKVNTFASLPFDQCLSTKVTDSVSRWPNGCVLDGSVVAIIIHSFVKHLCPNRLPIVHTHMDLHLLNFHRLSINHRHWFTVTDLDAQSICDSTIYDRCCESVDFIREFHFGLLSYIQGELVWFDPGVGCVQPGEIVEYHRSAQVVVVESDVSGKVLPSRFSNLSFPVLYLMWWSTNYM